MRPLSDEPSIGADARALRISLQQTPYAPALARAAITGFSDGSDIEPARLATLLLLVSEVVTNAVVHSTAPAPNELQLFAVKTASGAMRVEVTDRGQGFVPSPRDPRQPGGGFGLYLVDREALAWGVDRVGGTRVWFELATEAG